MECVLRVKKGGGMDLFVAQFSRAEVRCCRFRFARSTNFTSAERTVRNFLLLRNIVEGAMQHW